MLLFFLRNKPTYETCVWDDCHNKLQKLYEDQWRSNCYCWRKLLLNFFWRKKSNRWSRDKNKTCWFKWKRLLCLKKRKKTTNRIRKKYVRMFWGGRPKSNTKKNDSIKNNFFTNILIGRWIMSF